MRTRIISGAVLLALVGLVAWVQGLLLIAAILVAVALAAGEFYGMARAGGFRPWRAGGIVLALALTLPAALLALPPGISVWPGGTNTVQTDLFSLGAQSAFLETTTLLLLAAGLLTTLVWRGSHGQWATGSAGQGADQLTQNSKLKTQNSPVWADVGLTLAGAVYTGGILKYGLLLGQAPGALWWILLVVLGTAAADSGAYFVGRAWGKRKLIPHISPKKTWAGFWGGLACCVLAVGLLAWPMRISSWHILPLGLAIGVSSVLGDLCESLLKRSFGVKDSSRLIPGHGGLLDRLDSILFVLLVVYVYMRYFYS